MPRTMNFFRTTSPYLTLVVLLTTSIAQASPQHTGAASCASSNCHGSVSPRVNSNIQGNEYTTWFKFSAHAQAWKVLTTEDSKKIAKHLGIEKPEEDKLCLTCHTTYIPEELQGVKYRVEDGVSCEACHGAAENYLRSHTSRTSTHEENVANGLIDLNSMEERTKLCLSCHHGNDDQTVNHRLIGAGHPRLTFELDTFGMIQPKHWKNDADYKERKINYSPAQAWIVGQTTRAVEMLKAMQSPVRSKQGKLPELSLFTCYSCHHNLKDDRWKYQSYDGHPGIMQLNLSSLTMVEIALKIFGYKDADKFSTLKNELNISLYHGEDEQKVQALKDMLTGSVSSFLKQTKPKEKWEATLKALVKFSIENTPRSFETAEQLIMGAAAILAELDRDGADSQKHIDALYESLNDEELYNPKKFKIAAKKFLKFIN